MAMRILQEMELKLTQLRSELLPSPSSAAQQQQQHQAMAVMEERADQVTTPQIRALQARTSSILQIIILVFL